jgi:hypothetical protein
MISYSAGYATEYPYHFPTPPHADAARTAFSLIEVPLSYRLFMECSHSNVKQ